MNRTLFHVLLTAFIILIACELCAEDRERDACLEFGFGNCGTNLIVSTMRWAGDDTYKWACLGIGFAVPVGFGILHNEGQIKDFGTKSKTANRLDERQIAFGSSFAVITQLLIKWHPPVEIDLGPAPKVMVRF